MIRKAIYWAVGGLMVCLMFGLNVTWTLIVTIATAIAGAL